MHEPRPLKAREIASTIVAPRVDRAQGNTYTETRGAKLYKRGGTMATRVVVRTFQPSVKIVNTARNAVTNGY